MSETPEPQFLYLTTVGRKSGKPHQIAVHDGTKRIEKTVSLYAGASQDWPPIRQK